MSQTMNWFQSGKYEAFSYTLPRCLLLLFDYSRACKLVPEKAGQTSKRLFQLEYFSL